VIATVAVGDAAVIPVTVAVVAQDPDVAVAAVGAAAITVTVTVVVLDLFEVVEIAVRAAVAMIVGIAAEGEDRLGVVVVRV
jgi:hypothetical protein